MEKWKVYDVYVSLGVYPDIPKEAHFIPFWYVQQILAFLNFLQVQNILFRSVCVESCHPSVGSKKSKSALWPTL